MCGKHNNLSDGLHHKRAAKRAKNYGERKPHTNASGWCAFVGVEENLQAKNLVGIAEVSESAG